MKRQEQSGSYNAPQIRMFQPQDLSVPNAGAVPAIVPGSDGPRDLAARDPHAPLSREEIRGYMNSDFFESLSTRSNDADEPTRLPAKPVLDVPDKPRRGEVVATPSSTAPAQPNANQQAVSAMLARVNALIAGQEQAAAQPPERATAPRGPMFNFLVPMEVVIGLRDENDGNVQKHVSSLINVSAEMAVATVENMLQKLVIPGILAQVRNEMQEYSKARDVLGTFYAEFPELQNPIVAPMVAAISDQFASEVQAKTGKPVDKADINFMRIVGQATKDFIQSMGGAYGASASDSPNESAGQTHASRVQSNHDPKEATKPPRERSTFMVTDRSARPEPVRVREGDDDMDDVASAAGIRRW